MTEILISLTGTILVTMLGGLTMSIRNAHGRIDELNKNVVTREELREKLEDKLEAIRVENKEMKESIRELKDMVRSIVKD